jgi:hypothetical protein
LTCRLELVEPLAEFLFFLDLHEIQLDPVFHVGKLDPVPPFPLQDLEDVEPVGTLDDPAGLALGQGEDDPVEGLRHDAPGEHAEIASLGCLGARGDLLGDLAEILPGLDPPEHGVGLLLRGDDDLGDVHRVLGVVSAPVGLVGLLRLLVGHGDLRVHLLVDELFQQQALPQLLAPDLVVHLLPAEDLGEVIPRVVLLDLLDALFQLLVRDLEPELLRPDQHELLLDQLAEGFALDGLEVALRQGGRRTREGEGVSELDGEVLDLDLGAVHRGDGVLRRGLEGRAPTARGEAQGRQPRQGPARGPAPTDLVRLPFAILHLRFPCDIKKRLSLLFSLFGLFRRSTMPRRRLEDKGKGQRRLNLFPFASFLPRRGHCAASSRKSPLAASITRSSGRSGMGT